MQEMCLLANMQEICLLANMQEIYLLTNMQEICLLACRGTFTVVSCMVRAGTHGRMEWFMRWVVYGECLVGVVSVWQL